MREGHAAFIELLKPHFCHCKEASKAPGEHVFEWLFARINVLRWSDPDTISRACASVLPPGENGTMILIVLLG